MLLGDTKSAAVKNIKSEEEVTEKMLEDLKQKLLSSRDKFILSNKDTLPELAPKQAKPALFKTSSSVMSDHGGEKNGDAALKSSANSDPVFTGQHEKRSTAVKQIVESFERS